MASSKVQLSPVVTHSISFSPTVAANDIYTATLTVNDAKYGIIKGYAIGSNTRFTLLQAFFSASDVITVRIESGWSSAASCDVTIFYC